MSGQNLWGVAGVYAVINICDGRFYVGYSANLAKRRRDYCKVWDTDLPDSLLAVSGYLLEEMRRYGRSAFTFRVLEVFSERIKTREDLLALEESYILAADWQQLYNVMGPSKRLRNPIQEKSPEEYDYTQLEDAFTFIPAGFY